MLLLPPPTQPWFPAGTALVPNPSAISCATGWLVPPGARVQDPTTEEQWVPPLGAGSCYDNFRHPEIGHWFYIQCTKCNGQHCRVGLADHVRACSICGQPWLQSDDREKELLDDVPRQLKKEAAAEEQERQRALMEQRAQELAARNRRRSQVAGKPGGGDFFIIPHSKP